ncbi:hypothetical protein L1049_016748 [Liquidambar formosana]|uniref:Uncharacterized protein n=1 Tax=Liquidambar formosana TaxID=63359 RepID=A0AAP0S0E3_LIQFO
MATSQCLENPPILSSTCGEGCVQELGGLQTYITGPQDSKLAILVISDAYGMVVVKLASSDDIRAAVLLHPGPITVDEIKNVKIPLVILGAEIDNHSPPEQLKQLGEILSGKSNDSLGETENPSIQRRFKVKLNLPGDTQCRFFMMGKRPRFKHPTMCLLCAAAENSYPRKCATSGITGNATYNYDGWTVTCGDPRH